MSARITIAEIATLKHCPALASEIREALVPGGDVEIIAEGVATGDLTTVQILLSARKTAASIGCGLRVVHPSVNFLALFRRAGVEGI